MMLSLLTACGGSPESTVSAMTTAGPQGPAGTPGITASQTVACSHFYSGFSFKYKYTTFSDSSVLITCSVADGLYQSSNVEFYMSSQVGSSDKGCTVTLDSNGAATAGWWNFSAAGARTATYNDSSDPSDGTQVTFADSDCVTN